MADHVTLPTRRRSIAFLACLIALGLAGVASLLLMPLDALLAPGVDVPPELLLVQPAVLVVVFSLAGWWAAPKLGLDAPVLGGLVEGGEWLASLRRMLQAGVLGGLLSAAVLIIYGLATATFFIGQGVTAEFPLATRILYGGITEEIMTRWGLMSLLALAAWKLGIALPRALWAGNIVAALLFGLGHFGALFALVPDPPVALLAGVLVANMVPALVFGWLFIQRGLEAAMIAHALAHVLAIGVFALVW